MQCLKNGKWSEVGNCSSGTSTTPTIATSTMSTPVPGSTPQNITLIKNKKYKSKKSHRIRDQQRTYESARECLEECKVKS